MSSDEKSITPVTCDATEFALSMENPSSPGEAEKNAELSLQDESDKSPQTTMASITADSSDVEVLLEDSSDSIEILDPEKNADRNSIRTLTADLEGSGNVSPIKPQPLGASQVAPIVDELMQRFNDSKLAPISYENIYDSSDYPSADDEDMNTHRPDSLSLPKPLQYYERSKKFGRGMSESSISTSSSLDALIEEVSKTPLSKQVGFIKYGW